MSLVVGFGLFVIATASDHFVDRHLWDHIALRHVPRIFGWTLGSLLVLVGLRMIVDIDMVVAQNGWTVLGFAGLLGIIPESGPHLIFASLYAEDALPLGILVASSAVQDGHGMLPMLAHSRTDFLKVKGVNLAVGLLIGGVMLALGIG